MSRRRSRADRTRDKRSNSPSSAPEGETGNDDPTRAVVKKSAKKSKPRSAAPKKGETNPRSKRQSAEEGEEDTLSKWKSNGKTIAGAVGLALLIRVVLFEAFAIEGESMEPTLLNSDRVVVAKFMYGLFPPFKGATPLFGSIPGLGGDEALLTWGMPEPGQVVIVHSPMDDMDIVKRVIGVAGDRIEIREWEVFRNGESIQRRELGPCRSDEGVEDPTDCVWTEEGIGDRVWRTSRSRFADNQNRNMEPRTVPANRVFVLGDHRDHSNDSREPRVGMIPASRIKGRALAIYWSSEGRIRWDRIFRGID